MREVSPVENMSAEDFLALAPEWIRDRASQIRVAKREGRRLRPSASLVDKSALLDSNVRSRLLDMVAGLVDENLFGRFEMCIQFADLLHRALTHVGLPARPAIGVAIYYSAGRESFRWGHTWVRVGTEVIDGNVDSLIEDPAVPPTVTVPPYWGPITETPTDRRLQEDQGKRLPPDRDVPDIWWPELRAWLDKEFGGTVKPSIR